MTTPIDRDDASHEAHAGCASCALTSRRTFVRDAIGAVAAILAVAAGASVAEAKPLVTRGRAVLGGNTKSYPFPAADGVSVDKDAEVIIMRAEGFVYAFNLSCPHQNVAIRWLEKDHRFQCPKHKSKYRADGTFIEGRATRGLDRFSIRHEGGNLVVDLDAYHKQDADPTGWAAARLPVT